MISRQRSIKLKGHVNLPSSEPVDSSNVDSGVKGGVDEVCDSNLDDTEAHSLDQMLG